MVIVVILDTHKNHRYFEIMSLLLQIPCSIKDTHHYSETKLASPFYKNA